MTAKSSETDLLPADRLLPVEGAIRGVAQDLLSAIEGLPLLSPHGHVPADWFRQGYHFEDATDLLIRPDHYVLRMFASQGHSYETFGVTGDGSKEVADSRTAFQNFAANYHLFRGTPSRLWLDYSLYEVLGVPKQLTAESADWVFDHINERLTQDAYTPRNLYQSFGIGMLATTDAATDGLADHSALLEDKDWSGHIVPTFRPDSVIDPDHPSFVEDIALLRTQTGRDLSVWDEYLAALQDRRDFFKSLGATATDHGVPTPATANYTKDKCQALLTKVHAGTATAAENEAFRAQMMFEMARMSTKDGLVMQIHAGSWRNYSPHVFSTYGRDHGFDLPMRTSWTDGLKPLLDAFGFDENLTIILFTLDESTHGRELAPLAGAFPCLRLGAPWWFFDSPNGMSRHFDLVVETTGFYNLSGFVDDTRAMTSIPARHDVYRRVVAGKLATMVAQHMINKSEALELAEALCIGLVKDAYKLK